MEKGERESVSLIKAFCLMAARKTGLVTTPSVLPETEERMGAGTR